MLSEIWLTLSCATFFGVLLNIWLDRNSRVFSNFAVLGGDLSLGQVRCLSLDLLIELQSSCNFIVCLSLVRFLFLFCPFRFHVSLVYALLFSPFSFKKT